MANIPFSVNNHFIPDYLSNPFSSGQNLFEPDAIFKYLSNNDIMNNFNKLKVSHHCYECFILLYNSI